MDMMKMMKQASDLQKNMKKKQKELSTKKVDYNYQGISIQMSCDMKILSINIDSELLNLEDTQKMGVQIR